MLKRALFFKGLVNVKAGVRNGKTVKPYTRSVHSTAKPLEGHPYHGKTDAELHYIMKDAGEASRLHDQIHPGGKRYNKYADQVNDAATVLHYRKGRQPLHKAHVNDYTKKDGTVVPAHEDNRPGVQHAQAAAAAAARSQDSVHGADNQQLSAMGVGESQRANSPRAHMQAGQVHRELAQKHRTAAHSIKQRGGRDEDIQHHVDAGKLHQAAAAEHEQAASKGRR